MYARKSRQSRAEMLATMRPSTTLSSAYPSTNHGSFNEGLLNLGQDATNVLVIDDGITQQHANGSSYFSMTTPSVGLFTHPLTQRLRTTQVSSAREPRVRAASVSSSSLTAVETPAAREAPTPRASSAAISHVRTKNTQKTFSSGSGTDISQQLSESAVASGESGGSSENHSKDGAGAADEVNATTATTVPIPAVDAGVDTAGSASRFNNAALKVMMKQQHVVKNDDVIDAAEDSNGCDSDISDNEAGMQEMNAHAHNSRSPAGAKSTRTQMLARPATKPPTQTQAQESATVPLHRPTIISFGAPTLTSHTTSAASHTPTARPSTSGLSLQAPSMSSVVSARTRPHSSRVATAPSAHGASSSVSHPASSSASTSTSISSALTPHPKATQLATGVGAGADTGTRAGADVSTHASTFTPLPDPENQGISGKVENSGTRMNLGFRVPRRFLSSRVVAATGLQQHVEPVPMARLRPSTHTVSRRTLQSAPQDNGGLGIAGTGTGIGAGVGSGMGVGAREGVASGSYAYRLLSEAESATRASEHWRQLYEDQRSKYITASDELSRVQAKHIELQARYGDRVTEAGVASQRLEDALRTVKQLETRVNTLKRESAVSRSALQKYLNGGGAEMIKEHQEEVHGLQERLSTANVHVRELEEQKQEALRAVDAAHAREQTLEARVRELENAVADLSGEHARQESLAVETAETRGANALLQQQVRRMEAKAEEARRREEALISRVDELSTAHAAVCARRDALERELEELKAVHSECGDLHGEVSALRSVLASVGSKRVRAAMLAARAHDLANAAGAADSACGIRTAAAASRGVRVGGARANAASVERVGAREAKEEGEVGEREHAEDDEQEGNAAEYDAEAEEEEEGEEDDDARERERVYTALSWARRLKKDNDNTQDVHVSHCTSPGEPTGKTEDSRAKFPSKMSPLVSTSASTSLQPASVLLAALETVTQGCDCGAATVLQRRLAELKELKTRVITAETESLRASRDRVDVEQRLHALAATHEATLTTLAATRNDVHRLEAQVSSLTAAVEENLATIHSLHQSRAQALAHSEHSRQTHSGSHTPFLGTSRGAFPRVSGSTRSGMATPHPAARERTSPPPGSLTARTHAHTFAATHAASMGGIGHTGHSTGVGHSAVEAPASRMYSSPSPGLSRSAMSSSTPRSPVRADSHSRTHSRGSQSTFSSPETSTHALAYTHANTHGSPNGNATGAAANPHAGAGTGTGVSMSVHVTNAAYTGSQQTAATHHPPLRPRSPDLAVVHAMRRASSSPSAQSAKANSISVPILAAPVSASMSHAAPTPTLVPASRARVPSPDIAL